jgi:hypothetical protein
VSAAVSRVVVANQGIYQNEKASRPVAGNCNSLFFNRFTGIIVVTEFSRKMDAVEHNHLAFAV